MSERGTTLMMCAPRAPDRHAALAVSRRSGPAGAAPTVHPGPLCAAHGPARLGIIGGLEPVLAVVPDRARRARASLLVQEAQAAVPRGCADAYLLSRCFVGLVARLAPGYRLAPSGFGARGRRLSARDG